MILIGQYDSPFVRRVAIAMHLYRLAYEHRGWSTFAEGDLIARYNPLRRVPVLVLDDETALIESGAILDYLDEGAVRPLIAPSGPARRASLRRIALATGLADKAVSLVYERLLHDTVSAQWSDRCIAQIRDTLALLEAERATCPGSFWHGDTPGHDDIALACALRFASEAHPGLIALEATPALNAHAIKCESMPLFMAVSQRFIPPS